jgi:hypothetical protein
MKHRPLFITLLLGVCVLCACGRQTPTPLVTDRRARTEHLTISFPEHRETRVQEFLLIAEDLYADVNGLFDGALPATIDVTLADEGDGRFPESVIVLNLEDRNSLTENFARELVLLAFQQLAGDHGSKNFGFVGEGLACWVEEQIEWRQGVAEPRPLRAAYGYTLGWAELAQLERWEQATRELDAAIAHAIGCSFVTHFVNVHGQDGLLRLLNELPRQSSVCAALDSGGFECADFVRSWHTVLEIEATNHVFASVPQIAAELSVTDEGQLRTAAITVRIVNPHLGTTKYCVSYDTGHGWQEECHTTRGGDRTAEVPLGQVAAGTTVMWDAAVWSETLQSWVRAGQQGVDVP